jgi:putative ABC transport system permease protein
MNLQINQEIHQSIVNLGYNAFGLLVVNDRQYQTLTASVPDSKKFVSYGYDLKNWASTQPTIEKIEHAIPKGQQENFFSRVEPYLQSKQFGSLTMFIGIFVSLLFFIAAGSLIYFKLFTELQEDKAQFQALHRIGMTDQEMRKIMTRQIGLIFFVPFVVGAVHALFAFKMLQNMKIFGDVWAYGGIVIGIFFVMQLIYFFITRQTYVRQIVK